MRRRPSSDAGARDAGLTGLQELAVAIGVAALLSVGAMFTYRVLVSGAGDRAAQVTVGTALAAAHDVYEQTQDYALIGSSQPSSTPAGGCNATTSAFSLMASYAAGVDVRCGTLTAFDAGAVVVSTGELTDGDAGGWIGMATLAKDGRCWQVYQPADGPAVYGSLASSVCGAPAAAPVDGGPAW
jgi:hypothetical protein